MAGRRRRVASQNAKQQGQNKDVARSTPVKRSATDVKKQTVAKRRATDDDAIFNYRTAWRLFLTRITLQDDYYKFYENHASEIGLDKVQTMISVGPGDGDPDIFLLKNNILPRLTKYTGIDPYDELMNDLRIRLKEAKPKLKNELLVQDVETWDGPSEPVDFVLMQTMVLHLKKREESVAKCYSWVKPGGILLVTAPTATPVFKAFAERYLVPDRTMRQTELPTILDAIKGPKDTLSVYPLMHTMDYTTIPKMLAQFFFLRTITDSEYESYKEFIKEFVPTGIQQSATRAFVLIKSKAR